MGLKILYGRAGSGKSYNIYQNIRSLVHSGKKVFLCVPEQFTHMTERRVMEIIGSISPLSCQVISFERIIQRVYEESGESVCDVISDTVRSVLMSKAINSGNLKLYSRMSSNEGFVSLMNDMITGFKKYCVFPDDILKLKDNISNQMTKEKLSDIAEIYSSYQNILKEKYTDSTDLLTSVRDMIGTSGFFDGSYVFFDEFSSFIPPELDVIFEIAKSAEEVTVSLCTDVLNYTKESRFSFFSPSIITSSKLINGAAKNGIKVHKSQFLGENMRHKKDSALYNIEKNLYSSFEKVGYAENNVSINSYFDAVSEVKHTASKILSLCRDEGFKFKDIAVICSNLDAYSGIIDDVFKKFNIRTFIDEKTPLIDIHPAQFVLGALRIYTESYSYESIFSYLRLGFLDMTDEEIDILEEYVLNMSINKSDWTNDLRWNDKLDKFSRRADLNEKYLKIINSSRKKFLKSITEFHNRIKGRHIAEKMCDALYDYMKISGFEKKIVSEIKDFEALSMLDEAKTVTLVWNKIISILDEISEGLSDTLINPKEFYTYLKVAFTSSSIGLLPTSSDCVTVGNADRSRIKNVKVLFVLGATENSFPKKPSTFGIFTTGEKNVLSEYDIEFIKNSLDEIYYQRFLVYSVLTIPEKSLYISYPYTEITGDTAREAMVVTMIKRNLGIDTVYVSDDDENFVLNSPYTSWEYVLQGIRKDTKKWERVFSVLSLIYPEKADILKRSLLKSETPAMLSDEVKDKYFSDVLYTTVTRLEKFAACKFSYFLRFMLNLEPRYTREIDFANIGTLSHAVFEMLCKEAEAKFNHFSGIDENYIRERVAYYIREITKDMGIDIDRVSARERFKITRLEETLSASFIHLVRQIADSRFSPLGYEIRFDDKGLGCVELKLNSGKTVKLTGVIDRADSYKTPDGEFIRVIDYKTNNKEFSFENLFYGLDFQLFVYLDALTRSNPDYRPAGALYFKINDFILSGKKYDDIQKLQDETEKHYSLKGLISSEDPLGDAFDIVTFNSNKRNAASEDRFYMLFNHLEKKATELAQGIMEGIYTIDPYVKGVHSSCSYCDFSSVCRFKGKFRNIDTLKADSVWERLEEDNYVDN